MLKHSLMCKAKWKVMLYRVKYRHRCWFCRVCFLIYIYLNFILNAYFVYFLQNCNIVIQICFLFLSFKAEEYFKTYNFCRDTIFFLVIRGEYRGAVRRRVFLLMKVSFVFRLTALPSLSSLHLPSPHLPPPCEWSEPHLSHLLIWMSLVAPVD